MLTNEEWRPVPATDYRYLVSSYGRLMGPSRRILRPAIANTGRPMVTIIRTDGGKPWNVQVHRIVAWAFHGAPPFPGAIVRHLDGNETNNAAINLRWGTDLENAADRLAHGTAPRGERSGAAKLTEDQVLHIQMALDLRTPPKDLARRFGVSRSTIYAIRNGRVWGWLDAAAV